MKAKHSKAPWSFGIEQGLEISIDSDGDEQYAIATTRHGDPSVNHANAALIAAAPELLELLVEAANLIRNGFGPIHPDSSAGGFLVDADAIIAKATGSGS